MNRSPSFELGALARRAKLAAAQKGQVLILTAFGMVVLVGSVGLAVDSGIGYMSRAKLNAAVDAAGIAAARAVTQGADQAAQAASARQAAREFFAANYPNGYLGSKPTLDDPAVTFNQGQVAIDVSAHADRPLFLMRVLGFNRMEVGAASQTIRKDLDLSFVMDTSGSMSGVAQKVREAGISFLQFLSPTTDRVALIHFATGGLVDDPIRKGQQRGFDRAALQQHIGKFQFNGSRRAIRPDCTGTTSRTRRRRPDSAGRATTSPPR